jgi:hypothetical protein
MAHSKKGRTIYVEFKCKRCGKTHYEPYDNQYNAESGRTHENPDYFKAPEGWRDTWGLPLLCDECANIYDTFMKDFLPTP